MISNVSLNAYFERIDYNGPRFPTLDVLHAITSAHAHKIPFENLDILLGQNIDITLESVFNKLVHQNRGGYCFEQNGLLLYVLRQLGFNVTPISGRVRIDRPREITPPRTHVLLLVKICGESWLTDVGLGGLSLTSAIQCINNVEQTTPHEKRRIIHENDRYFHQVLFNKEWVDVCEFTLEEMPNIDQELANWFTSSHPKSHFKDKLMVARASQDGKRYTLINRVFSVRGQDGISHKTTITSPQELLDVLHEKFGLIFHEGTRFNSPGLQWDD